MKEFVIFEKGKQKEFMNNAKKNSNFNWNNLAHKIEKNRSTLFLYLEEKCKMPYLTFLNLVELSQMDKSKISYSLIKISNLPVKITRPKISTELAEFLGILAGDGYISSKKPYEVSVTCHKVLDREFIANNVKILFQELFKLNSKILENKKNNGIKAKVYSKELIIYLNKEFGQPLGKKKGRLKIPSQIKNNNNLLKSYIRGLFDTDGSFYGRRNNEPVIEIISKDKRYAQEVHKELNRLNFRANLNGKNISIYRKEQIDKFFNDIKPNNKKHLLKYETFKKYGIIPKNVRR